MKDLIELRQELLTEINMYESTVKIKRKLLKAVKDSLIAGCYNCNFNQYLSLFTNNYYLDLLGKYTVLCIDCKTKVQNGLDFTVN